MNTDKKDKVNIIAFYLPQFHEIPENNEWWGQGFTEWTNVKAAKALFRNHIQSRVPLNQNYYNLLEKRVMNWQADIARKAGVNGFCFYHYWFKGRKLLEKPVENYLNWTDINQNYCLSWANESWIRTWSKAEGNDWNEIADKERGRQKGTSILMQQDYGNKSDWAEHFNYLLPFFKDSRYIQIESKPVFIIYKPDKVTCLKAMMKYWNELALINGLKGIYVIGTNTKNSINGGLDASIMYEPAYTLAYDKPLFYRLRDMIRTSLIKYDITMLKTYHYSCIWNKIIKRKIKSDKKIYKGAFINFDDSPRRGRNAAIFTGVKPEKFENYLKKLINKESDKEKYIFLTAWNEWAEGAYMEPDEYYRYSFLKAVRNAVNSYRKI